MSCIPPLSAEDHPKSQFSQLPGWFLVLFSFGKSKKYGIVAEDNDTITTVAEPELGIVKCKDAFWLTKDNETFCAITKRQLVR